MKPIKTKKHIAILIALTIIFFSVASTLTIRHYWYLVAKQAFENSQYELFAHYLNRSKSSSFEIPKDVAVIPFTAFRDCQSIDFHIYKGCNYLECYGNPYYALIVADEQRDVYEIHPDTVLICEGAFGANKKIMEFIVPEENQNFISLNGSLYDKDCTRLIHYATGKTCSVYKVPETVRTIDAYAFYYASYLRNITLPKNITRIGKCAFGYTLIECINIPNTAVWIECGAFSNSTVREITYHYDQ